MKKKSVYFIDKEYIYDYISYFESQGIEVVSLFDFILNERNDSEFDNIFVDISTFIHDIDIIENNSTIFNSIEQVIFKLDENITFICDLRYEKILFKHFYFLFEKCELDFVIEEKYFKENLVETRRLIIDLDNEEVDKLITDLKENLVGHNIFKSDLKNIINNFQIFNSIDEIKILPVFILGDSGVGKTEVAKIINNNLDSTSTLTKISFGNYSSQGALNSLIGSPRGYIGSDDGELFKKIRKSKTGIILIDEFEKADLPVHNFFLELLETGIAVDSQGDEISLNGYIIVFTSNMTSKDFYNNVSTELRNRFINVFEFKSLPKSEIDRYIEKRVGKIFERLLGTEYIKVLNEGSLYKIIEKAKKLNINNIRILNSKIMQLITDEINDI